MSESFTVILMFFVFVAINFLLSITIVTLSSKICPSEIKEELYNFDKTVARCAFVDKLLENFIVPCLNGDRVSASGRITEGPIYGLMFVKHC